MIAKITRGTRAGDIAAYLHGPGKTAMHTYRCLLYTSPSPRD